MAITVDSFEIAFPTIGAAIVAVIVVAFLIRRYSMPKCLLQLAQKLENKRVCNEARSVSLKVALIDQKKTLIEQQIKDLENAETTRKDLQDLEKKLSDEKAKTL